MASFDQNWVEKYKYFNVPANAFFGGDSLNIKKAAQCKGEGYELYKQEECYTEPNVPKYNYPSIWAKAYGLFENQTMDFFKKFWMLNAVFLACTITILCYVLNYKLLPLFLFSPITLLTIERGNIDGITFAVTFLPLVISKSKTLWGAAIVLATALKIYPIAALLPFLSRSKPYLPWGIIAGSALLLPLATLSIIEIPHYVNATTKGFEVAYGLFSISHSHWIGNNTYSTIIVTIYLTTCCVLVYKSCGQINIDSDFSIWLSNLDTKSKIILATSLSIFIVTFIFFTNWAYRLIFIMPALLVISKSELPILRTSYWCGMTIIWAPILPFGWIAENIACYVFAPLSAIVLILYFKSNRNSIQVTHTSQVIQREQANKY